MYFFLLGFNRNTFYLLYTFALKVVFVVFLTHCLCLVTVLLKHWILYCLWIKRIHFYNKCLIVTQLSVLFLFFSERRHKSIFVRVCLCHKCCWSSEPNPEYSFNIQIIPVLSRTTRDDPMFWNRIQCEWITQSCGESCDRMSCCSSLTVEG